MPDVSVNFVRPTDRRSITVALDDSITAEEAINELLANNFVTPGPDSYQLVHNDDALLPNQTLAEAGIRNGDKISVNPNLVAGARPRS
jgi:hypothetical protein